MKKYIDGIISLTLVVALMLSIFVFSYPAVSAAESDGAEVAYDIEDELAEIGYTHRNVSLDSIPADHDTDIRTDITELYLNRSVVYLDINERYQLNLLDAYSHTINTRAVFTSSNTLIADVSASGVITAKKSGMTTVAVSDRVTESVLTCTVYVGEGYAPTQPPAPKPTDEPTDPPSLLSRRRKLRPRSLLRLPLLRRLRRLLLSRQVFPRPFRSMQPPRLFIKATIIMSLQSPTPLSVSRALILLSLPSTVTVSLPPLRQVPSPSRRVLRQNPRPVRSLSNPVLP